MLKEFLLAGLTLLLVSAATAQPPATGARPSQKTYFLVDASDSMDDPSADGTLPKTYADKILRRELLELVTPNSRADASINFFRANTKRCNSGTASVGPQVPIPDPLPESPKSTGATNLGAVFEAALNDAAGQDARIVIITDGGQSENCGFHICTVAGERLTGLRGVSVEQYWARADQETSVPFQCIQDALQARDQTLSAAPAIGKKPPEKGATDASGQSGTGSDKPPQPISWDQANFLERWHWLAVCAAFVFAAFSIASIFGKQAHLYENKIERINQKLRIAATQKLDGGVDDDPSMVLSEEDLSPPSDDQMKVAAAGWRLYACWSGGVGIVLLVLLLGWETSWTFLNIGEYARNARTIGWTAVGSEFSNFAILAAAPIFYAGAQHSRRAHAQRTFALVTNSATTAEQQKKNQRAQEAANKRFDEYKRLRQNVSEIEFASGWLSRRPYSERDRANFVSVAKKATYYAMGGEELERDRVTKSVLDELRPFTSSWFDLSRLPFNRDLPGFIQKLFNNPNANGLKLPVRDERDAWLELAMLMRSPTRNSQRIRQLLAEVASA